MRSGLRAHAAGQVIFDRAAERARAARAGRMFQAVACIRGNTAPAAAGSDCG